MIKLQVLCGILPKISEILLSRFFLQSYENGTFSQFRSFPEKEYFLTWICKWWKLIMKSTFLNCWTVFLIYEEHTSKYKYTVRICRLRIICCCFQCFHVTNFQNNKYLPKQKISITQIICGRIVQNCAELMPAWVNILQSAEYGDNIC